MGCCSCKLQCGQQPESELSQIILKIIEESSSQYPEPKPQESPIKLGDSSTIKPDFLTLNSNFKLNSPDVSKLDLSMSYKIGEDTIQEGELLKYRPGFTKQYISRWCVLTTENFMYFKNRSSGQIWGQSPLFTVPLAQIKTASKVNFKIPGVKENAEQFEIFLKSEDYTVKISRETDKMPLMRSIIDKASTNCEKDCVVKGMLMKRPLRHDSPERGDGEGLPMTTERVSWSMREVEWFTSEKRLLFIAESALERDFWILNILRACKDQ